MNPEVASCFYEARDGLRLHYTDTRPRHDAGRLPVVCLCGLTRAAPDFAPLARALASDTERARRVVAFDYRGRGLSAHDADWTRYDLATERDDLLVGLKHCGIEHAHFIGTSRGGLHIMALAQHHRALIHSVVLNDIGPVLEPAGLARIKGYVGKTSPRPGSFAEAIKLLQIGAAEHFDGLSGDEWRFFAATTFGDEESDLRLRYDPRLARTLDSFDLSKPLPDSWPLFDLLRDIPVLAIRGANSDLLSPGTLEAMGDRWRGCQTHLVPGQGHAPLLADAATIERITGFLALAD